MTKEKRDDTDYQDGTGSRAVTAEPAGTGAPRDPVQRYSHLTFWVKWANCLKKHNAHLSKKRNLTSLQGVSVQGTAQVLVPPTAEALRGMQSGSWARATLSQCNQDTGLRSVCLPGLGQRENETLDQRRLGPRQQHTDTAAQEDGSGETAGAASASLRSVLTDKAIVKKELLYFVAGKDKYRVNNKHDQKYSPLPPNEIVRRAEEKVGREILYNVTRDNCEHFVNELRYGVSRSDQVTEAVVAGSMMAGGMMAGSMMALRMAARFLPGLSVGLGLGLAVSALIGSLKDTGEQAGSTERPRNHTSSSRKRE
ncbi:uncharacterized protein LOC132241508 isoform X2 [Myotis daubentonii]|uniref:uncharacterized protein LOC132241508 isoform X2 n=1 Tax=Myotis daubentonii TaxID=98922 RepID=UPI00287382C7|nr:uncharacterized protein LOC132241508 isoform X2 [Myotis daubentonii]